MKKIYFFLVLILCYQNINGQIVITEINYDTPNQEDIYFYSNQHLDNPNPFRHHLGEYVELYNYTLKDISLNGWSLTDRVTRYDFPATAVIKSGEFLIVAYKETTDPNYFTTYFPNTVGQEPKIYYQDKMQLRNKREFVRLNMGGSYKGMPFYNFNIQIFGFGHNNSFSNGTPDNAWDENSDTNPSTFNFYLPSLHLTDINTIYNTTGHETIWNVSVTTPLFSNYTPPLQDIETIPTIVNYMNANFAYLTWDYYSNLILYNVCPDTIPIVDQTPSGTYLTTGKCFNYDNTGNIINATNCTPVAIVPNPNPNYTQAELNDIDSKIILAPNPTSSNITATWDATVVGKISQIFVANMNGTSLQTSTITPTQSSEIITLGGQPTGIYIVRFVLNTGQSLSRNAMKL
jgi:hypothetical protein